jgi:hypothetical protein
VAPTKPLPTARPPRRRETRRAYRTARQRGSSAAADAADDDADDAADDATEAVLDARPKHNAHVRPLRARPEAHPNVQRARASAPPRGDRRTCVAADTCMAADGPSYKYAEVVRGREARARLPAHDCPDCAKFFEAMEGALDSKAAAIALCSRHRAVHAPEATPQGFWDLSFPATP